MGCTCILPLNWWTHHGTSKEAPPLPVTRKRSLQAPSSSSRTGVVSRRLDLSSHSFGRQGNFPALSFGRPAALERVSSLRLRTPHQSASYREAQNTGRLSTHVRPGNRPTLRQTVRILVKCCAREHPRITPFWTTNKNRFASKPLTESRGDIDGRRGPCCS